MIRSAFKQGGIDTEILKGMEAHIREAEEVERERWAYCPICGTELDEYTDCGCFAELHYGD